MPETPLNQLCANTYPKLGMFRADPLATQAAANFAYSPFAQLAGRLLPHQVWS